MSVVKEQITRALEDRHNNYDQFKVKLSKLTYAEITNIWHMERKTQEEWASQARPIKQVDAVNSAYIYNYSTHLKHNITVLLYIYKVLNGFLGSCVKNYDLKCMSW